MTKGDKSPLLATLCFPNAPARDLSGSNLSSGRFPKKEESLPVVTLRTAVGEVALKGSGDPPEQLTLSTVGSA